MHFYWNTGSPRHINIHDRGSERQATNTQHKLISSQLFFTCTNNVYITGVHTSQIQTAMTRSSLAVGRQICGKRPLLPALTSETRTSWKENVFHKQPFYHFLYTSEMQSYDDYMGIVGKAVNLMGFFSNSAFGSIRAVCVSRVT